MLQYCAKHERAWYPGGGRTQGHPKPAHWYPLRAIIVTDAWRIAQMSACVTQLDWQATTCDQCEREENE